MEKSDTDEDRTNEENVDEIELLQMQRNMSFSGSDSLSSNESSVNESGTPQKRKAEQRTKFELKRKKIINVDQREGSTSENIASVSKVPVTSTESVTSSEHFTEFLEFSPDTLEQFFSDESNLEFLGRLANKIRKSLTNNTNELGDNIPKRNANQRINLNTESEDHEIKEPFRNVGNSEILLPENENLTGSSRHDHVHACNVDQKKEKLTNSPDNTQRSEPAAKLPPLESKNGNITAQSEILNECGELSETKRGIELALDSKNKTTKLIDNDDSNTPLQVNPRKSRLDPSMVLQDTTVDSCTLTPQAAKISELDTAAITPRKTKSMLLERYLAESLHNSPLFSENENAANSTTNDNALKQSVNSTQPCIVNNQQNETDSSLKSLKQTIMQNIKTKSLIHSKSPSPASTKTADSESRDEIFKNGKTFKEILKEFFSGNHERGECSAAEFVQCVDVSDTKEYPGIAKDLTKVKKDARYQKKFYRQDPVRVTVEYAKIIEGIIPPPTSPQPCIAEPDDQVEILGEYPRGSLNIKSGFPEKRNQKSPSRDENATPYPGLIPIESLSSASDSTRYQTASFMEDNDKLRDPRLLSVRDPYLNPGPRDPRLLSVRDPYLNPGPRDPRLPLEQKKDRRLSSETENYPPYPGIVPIASLFRSDPPNQYKVSSFMEESPESTNPSNSPEERDINLECFRLLDEPPPQITQRPSDDPAMLNPMGLTFFLDDDDTLMTMPQSQRGNETISTKKNSLFKPSTSARGGEPVSWVTVKYNFDGWVSPNKAIYHRDILYEPPPNSQKNLIPLRPFLEVLGFDNQVKHEEFSIDEFLLMLTNFQRDYVQLLFDSRRPNHTSSFPLPHFNIPIRPDPYISDDDDYELSDDNSLQIPSTNKKNVCLEQELCVKRNSEKTTGNSQTPECILLKEGENVGVVRCDSDKEDSLILETSVQNKVITENVSNKSPVRTSTDKDPSNKLKDIS